MPPDDWRSPAAYAYAADLDHPGMAWEYLRRNPDYCGAFENAAADADIETDGPARDWGLRFLADPDDRADDAAVFWRPEVSPAVIPLTSAPIVTPTTVIPLAKWPGEITRREAEDGLHVLVREDAATHQVWLIEPVKRAAPLAAAIPLDDTAPHRTDAFGRFWRFLKHPARRARTDRRRRLDRLITALRVLDGRMSGASYRIIAEALFGKARVAAEPWKTASLRDTVIRLARTGFSLKRGGYRGLLRPRRLA